MTQNATPAKQPDMQKMKEAVDRFNADFQAVMQRAEKDGVPIPFREAAMRDYLAAIEAFRMAGPLKQHMGIR